VALDRRALLPAHAVLEKAEDVVLVEVLHALQEYATFG
jgi:hypothetical protein